VSTFVHAPVGVPYVFAPGTIIAYISGAAVGTHTVAVCASSVPANPSPGFLLTGNAS